jgi:preprotein translocase subunit SecA
MRLFGGERMTNIMERVGFSDEAPIESGMVTKSLERAQSKVEAHNYEIRKHVLEYDDVMNKQREVIYGDRRAILRGTFDSREFMRQTLEAKVDGVVQGNAPENAHPSDWDLDEMLNELELIFPVKQVLSVEDIEKKDREEIRRILQEKALEAYEAKEAEVTPEILRMVEQRYLLLPIIDRMWVDHLYVMDHLKSGIGLRGFGQIDPRVEYEKEAYEIFEDLKSNIADEAIKGVFRVVIEQGPPDAQGAGLPGQSFEPIPSGEMIPQPSRPREVRTNRDDEEPAKPVHRDQRKVGRNELCPCGSGKKYKKCHGAAA